MKYKLEDKLKKRELGGKMTWGRHIKKTFFVVGLQRGCGGRG